MLQASRKILSRRSIRPRALIVERTMKVLDVEVLRMLEKHMHADGDYAYWGLWTQGDPPRAAA